MKVFIYFLILIPFTFFTALCIREILLFLIAWTNNANLTDTNFVFALEFLALLVPAFFIRRFLHSL